MTKAILILSILLGFQGFSSQAQEINFSTYADYGLEIINTPQDLDFDQVGPIISDGSTYQLDIHDGNYTAVEIVGVKYLDIFINVTADQNLTGSNSGDAIAFMLKAAYSNQIDDITDANSVPLKHINVVNNTFSIRAPILERQNQPPNPPPTPSTNATDLDPKINFSNPLYETFYLYLYGDITVPENASSDSYTGTITITVTYD